MNNEQIVEQIVIDLKQVKEYGKEMLWNEERIKSEMFAEFLKERK